MKRVVASLTRPRLIIAALVVVLLAGVGGIAWASVPDSQGKVHLCYNPKEADDTGGDTLKIIDPQAGGKCKKGRTELVVNQTGPQGLPGVPGQDGEPGQGGSPGPPGPSPIVAVAYGGTTPTSFGQVDSWVEVASTTIEIPDGYEALVLARFSTEAQCTGIGPCPVRILIGDTEAQPSGADAILDQERSNGKLELRSVDRSLDSLPAGAHEVKVQVYTSNGTAIRLAFWSLTVTAFLRSL